MLEPVVPPANRTDVRSTRFKYYIHDSINHCRLQLIGELTETDLPDLDGCWKTARTILDGRLLILDTVELASADPASRNWLDLLLAGGAKLLEADSAPSITVKTGFWRRLFSGAPKLGQSPTQAQ